MRSEDELAAQVARVSFPLAAIPTALMLRADLEINDVRYHLVVQIDVPDVDTGGAPVRLCHYLPLDPTLGDEDLLAFIRAAVRAVWLHEVDEALHVDGARWRDPHGVVPGTRMRMRGTVYEIDAGRGAPTAWRQ